MPSSRCWVCADMSNVIRCDGPITGKYYVQDTAAPGLKGVAQTLLSTFQYCRFVALHCFACVC